MLSLSAAQFLKQIHFADNCFLQSVLSLVLPLKVSLGLLLLLSLDCDQLIVVLGVFRQKDIAVDSSTEQLHQSVPIVQ